MPDDFESRTAPNSNVSALNGDPRHDCNPPSPPDVSLPQTVTNPAYSSSSDPYGYVAEATTVLPASPPFERPAEEKPTEIALSGPPSIPPPPPPPPDDDDGDGDEEEKGMLRMSFMEHLEELRARLIKALGGIVVAFLLSLTFCKPLWNIVVSPAVIALKNLHLNPQLVA